jgi:hypothetical protein
MNLNDTLKILQFLFYSKNFFNIRSFEVIWRLRTYGPLLKKKNKRQVEA